MRDSELNDSGSTQGIVPVLPSSLLHRAASWTGIPSNIADGSPQAKTGPSPRPSASFPNLTKADVALDNARRKYLEDFALDNARRNCPTNMALDTSPRNDLEDVALDDTQREYLEVVALDNSRKHSSTDVALDNGISICKSRNSTYSLPTNTGDECQMSLSDLLGAIRVDVQQCRRARTQRGLLHRTHHAIARNQHLTSLTHQIRMTLVDCVRSEDKDSFTTLYTAVKDAAVQDCASPLPNEDHDIDWCAKLSLISRTAVLSFLTKLKFDGTYLAARLSALSQKQLIALLPGSSKAESVLNHTASRSSLPLGYAVDQLIDHISAGSAPCILDSMWNIIRTNVDLVQTQNIWATVCARLICDQKAGSEKIVVHLINRFSEIQPWTGQTAFEEWMTETLQNGRFLLEQPKSFRQRIQMNQESLNAETQRTEMFFADATSKLLDILGQGKLFSQSALEFSDKILERLHVSPKHQKAYPAFILTRWLALSYLPDLLCSPEVYGLMSDNIITELARARVLKEICNRAQRVALDVLHAWRHNRPVQEHDLLSIHTILSIFQRRTTVAPASTPSTAEISLLAISADDVLATLDALFPPQRTTSICSDQNTLRSGLHSSASSISGFSLFRANSIPSADDLQSNQCDPAVEMDRSLDMELSYARDEIDDLLGTATTIGQQPFSVFRINPQDQRVLPNGDGTGLDSVDSTAAEPNTQWWSKVLELFKTRGSLFGAGLRNVPDTTLQLQLSTLLQRASAEAESRSDFVVAHNLMNALDGMANINEHSLHAVLAASFDKVLASTTNAQQASASYDRALQLAQEVLTQMNRILLNATSSLDVLRDKMWYTTTVRTSAEYERLQGLIGALHTMSKKRLAAKPVQVLRTTSSTRPGLTIPLKSSAQILDLVSAAKEHGGLNKLSSDQSIAVKKWLEHHQVQNLCTVEERIHKLCMEVRKVVEVLVNPSEAENPMLWRDMLYKGSKPAVLQLQPRRRENSRMMKSAFWTPYDSTRSIPQALSNTSSYECIDAKSPTLTSTSSNNFWSPAVTDTLSQSSATSVGSGWQTDCRSSKPSPQMEKQLYHRVTGYVLSEFNLFDRGSETDEALWSGIGGQLLKRQAQQPPTRPTRFDFRRAFRRMFSKFSAVPNPQVKLEQLVEMQKLLPAFMSSVGKRASMVDGFLEVLSDASIRPRTLLRDLQYIISLVPHSVLEDPTADNAFWNAAIAASKLKEESIRAMVETADAIIAFHTSNRGSASLAQHQRDAATFASVTHQPIVDIAAYSMSDAGILLQIAAKDGNAAAQRELATLYLTHPDLMDRVIAPFAQPKEVFRDELESKWKTQDRSRCDPLTMCVAHHWMLLSSRRGDGLAKEYLRQREEMERLP